MRHRRRLLSLIAGVVLVGALPTIAAANTTEAVAETGGMTLTIPGVPGITVGVTLDEFGNITQVSVDGAVIVLSDAPVHKVTFDLGTDGSTTVQVKAKGEKLSTKVKTSNLGSLVGNGTWVGDVFGDGTVTTVTYTIAQVGGDMPYLEITSVTVDSTVANSLSGPFTKADGDDDDNEQEYESQAKVTFTQDGYTKTLKIEVETKYDDDEDHAVNGVYGKLKIELKGKDRQVLAGADIYGAQSWTGLLCDGTTASVNYTVAQDGTLTVDDVAVADGASYSVDYDDNGFKVEFTDTAGNDGAKVKVELEDEHGTLELKVKSKTTTSCDDDDDDQYKSGDDDDDDDHSYKSDDDDDDEDDDHSNNKSD
ncbi:MAG: hypothetical protein M3094_05215, partial [Actinomycetia bacterium]|nr:hypothetical protein [Actinomycetes bacterium]